jgi:hypothetical protein
MSLDISRSFSVPLAFENDDKRISVYLIAFGISVLTVVFNLIFNIVSNFSYYGMIPFFTEEQMGMVYAGMIGSFYIVIFLLSMLVNAFLNGYILDSIQLEVFNNEYVMPSWEGNFLKFFLNGLVFALIWIIYVLVILMISLLPGVVLFIVFFAMKATGADAMGMLQNAWLPVSIVSIFLTVFLYMLFVISLPMITVNYAVKRTFFSAFNLFEIGFAIINDFVDYLLAVLISASIYMVFFAIAIFLCCTCIGNIFIPLIANFIVPLIIMNMFAQVYKTTIKI